MSAAARPALPYGAVMATGAASDLAGPAGAGFLRLPLLWLTVAVAVAIPVWLAPRRLGGRRRAGSVRPRHTRLGEFTIPIGLAVIGGGLAGLAGPWALWAAACAVGLAWVATAVLAAALLVPVAAAWPGTETVEGTWFLAPAALLADAIGAAGLASRLPAAVPHLLGWLALVTAGLGAAGYVLVAVLALLRVTARGLDGSARVSWWIAAGCGGLTAAALGRVSAVSPLHGSGLTSGLGHAALGFWCAGSVLLVPVLAGSASFLIHRARQGRAHRGRRPRGRIPWPPAFSTGVYALGAAQAGRLAGLSAVTAAAGVASVATIVLWAFTACSHLSWPDGRVTVSVWGGREG